MMKYTTLYNETEFNKVGRVFSTSSFGDAIILGKSLRRGNHYAIMFLDTKYKTDVRADKLKNGSIRDWYRPNVKGVGYLGVGKYRAYHKGKNLKAYTAWLGMMERCYGSKPKFHTYKGKVTVCERWHNYQNFCEDIQQLENFDSWKRGRDNGWCLDKDVCGNRSTYSKENCSFITTSENSREMNARISLEGTRDWGYTKFSASRKASIDSLYGDTDSTKK